MHKGFILSMKTLINEIYYERGVMPFKYQISLLSGWQASEKEYSASAGFLRTQMFHALAVIKDENAPGD